MVEHEKTVEENAINVTGIHPKVFKALHWNSDIKCFALSAVYYGQLMSMIPGGRMAELHGGKRVLLLCTLVATVATLMCPMAALWNGYAFIAMRVLVGLGTGPIIPAVFHMLPQWIPESERAFQVSFILSGYGVGSFLAVILSGALCGSDFLGGWPSVFYTGGYSGILWCLVCFYMMSEMPEMHPTISNEELQYISSGTSTAKTEKIIKVPWKHMACSLPLWVLAIGFFGQYWVLGFFATVHALYMGTVLKLEIVENGVLCCLPHLAGAFTTCLASYLVDVLLRSRTISVGCARKSATIISTFVSCVAFFGITLVGYNATAATLLFALAGICGQFVTFGVCSACIDIAPNLSGTVCGLVNIVGLFPFLMIPALVGVVTNYEISIEKWTTVFYITIAIVSVTALIFVIFGDLSPQYWGVIEHTMPGVHEMQRDEESIDAEPKSKQQEAAKTQDYIQSSTHSS